MIAHSNNLCKQASLYYYSLLSDDKYEGIPDFLIKHVANCKNCQAQLRDLKSALSKTEDSIGVNMGKTDTGIAMMLKLHFKYIGKEVTCETVKPFLPTLVEPSMKVKIPTPITSHIDNCQQCLNDLETIQKLNLSTKQLCKLSQLFADQLIFDTNSCNNVQKAIPSIVLLDFEKTNADILKHICICKDCRKLVFMRREMVRNGLLLSGINPGDFPCEHVRASDIFDYVIPYGFDPVNDQYSQMRQSLIAHIRTCPKCLSKMLDLHKTIFNIAERPESEIVTVYNISAPVKSEGTGQQNELYAGFPISVTVTNKKDIEVTQSPISRPSSSQEKPLHRVNLRPLYKSAIAAAAVLIIGLALLFSVPKAHGITIEQVYRAIEKVKNVYISKFVKNQSEPVEERWISKDLGIYVTKTAKDIVIWDTRSTEQKSKDYQSGSTEINKLTNDEISSIEKRMSGSLGLMPFENMQDIPLDAKWYLTGSKTLKTDEKVEVYNLEWIEYAYDGSPVFKKWIVNINSETKLPERIGCYTKSEKDKDYLLANIFEVKYISQNDMQEVLNEFAF
jgi:hypothetical protein